MTEVFARVAAQSLQVYGIEHQFVHLDSSSFHLHGQYDTTEPDTEAISITHGYSRDHRPDLKQVVVQCSPRARGEPITSQAAALPVWLEVLSGNSSDKERFAPSVQAYCQHLAAEAEPPYFVMDSAGYAADNGMGAAHPSDLGTDADVLSIWQGEGHYTQMARIGQIQEARWLGLRRRQDGKAILGKVPVEGESRANIEPLC